MSVQKRRIILNASTVKISGGLIVAQSYIEALCADSRYEIVLICPKIDAYKRYEQLTIKTIYVPDKLLRWSFRWLHDFIWLPKQIIQANSDLLITLNNIPARTPVQQVYLHDNPYLTHGFRSRVKMSIKRFLIHLVRRRVTLNRMRFVNEVWVQSALEGSLFKKRINFKGTIQVITPMIPDYLLRKAKKRLMLPATRPGTIRLICLANYFEHKNIERLFEVVELAVEEEYQLQLIFTLERQEGNTCEKQIEKIKSLPESFAMNIGHVPARQVGHVVNQCDGVILPSLMETFGLNCLDAWLNKKPYFISDLPYARGICGDSAIFFKPDSAIDILQTIKQAFSNEQEIKQAISTGVSKIQQWPGQDRFISKVDRAVGS